MYNIVEKAKAISSKIISWRRDFHRHPERGFQEERTSKIVADELRRLGIEVVEGVGRTGVVGILRGGKPGKVLAMRADMDALGIQEENDVPYKSVNDGIMHACGHDAHTAMLLGAATVLSGMKDRIRGTVKFVFQPCEEGSGWESEKDEDRSGAAAMIKDGVLENPDVDAIIGIHVWMGLPSGIIGVKSGPILASADEFEAVFTGKAGHGAYPHLCVDPIVMASSGVLNAQTIVSRNVNPLESAVVSFGAISGGTIFNAIPEKAKVIGTIRTFSEEVRSLVSKRLGEVLEGTAKALGGECNYRYSPFLSPTINDLEIAEEFRKVAETLFGKEKVVEPEPSMGGEDFSFYLKKVRGLFFLLGIENPEKGIVYPHHNPKFDVDEDVLYMGSALFAAFAVDYLS